MVFALVADDVIVIPVLPRKREVDLAREFSHTNTTNGKCAGISFQQLAAA